MKNKNETNKKKTCDNFSSLRVKNSTKDKAIKVLEAINKKDFGRKVSVDELISTALELVTKDDITKLQKSSLRNKDRQAIVYQLYCKKVKKVSDDEFIGITMSSDYFSFLESNKAELSMLGV